MRSNGSGRVIFVEARLIFRRLPSLRLNGWLGEKYAAYANITEAAKARGVALSESARKVEKGCKANGAIDFDCAKLLQMRMAAATD